MVFLHICAYLCIFMHIYAHYAHILHISCLLNCVYFCIFQTVKRPVAFWQFNRTFTPCILPPSSHRLITSTSQSSTVFMRHFGNLWSMWDVSKSGWQTGPGTVLPEWDLWVVWRWAIAFCQDQFIKTVPCYKLRLLCSTWSWVSKTTTIWPHSSGSVVRTLQCHFADSSAVLGIPPKYFRIYIGSPRGYIGYFGGYMDFTWLPVIHYTTHNILTFSYAIWFCVM